MRSIYRRFKKVSVENPFWSSYICFGESIRYQKFTKRIILKWFNKLVVRNDYDKKDKKDILKHLCDL
jgi:hypothetical protein